MRKFFTKRYLLPTAVLVVVLLGVFIFLHTRSQSKLAVSDTDVTLTDYAGKNVRFEQFVSGFNRKPLVVYFWATWCPYCKAEFVDLSLLKQQMGDRIEIIAINRGEGVTDARQFTDALALPAGISYLLDSGDALFKKLGGYAMPETVFINTAGENIFQKHGPISKDELNAEAAQALK